MRNWSKSREGGGFKGRMRPSWGAGTGEQYWMAAILVWCARCCGAMLDSHHLGVVCPYTAEALPHTQFCCSMPTRCRAAEDRYHFGVVWNATCCRAVLDSRHFGVECPHTAGKFWRATILLWSVLTLQSSAGWKPFWCRMVCPHAVGQYQMDTILVWCGAVCPHTSRPNAVHKVQDLLLGMHHYYLSCGIREIHHSWQLSC